MLPLLSIDRDGRVFNIEFLGNGHEIFVSGEEGVRVFDIRTGTEKHFESPITQMTFNVVEDSKVFSLAFSPDGTRLTSGTHSKHVRVWDTGCLHN